MSGPSNIPSRAETLRVEAEVIEAADLFIDRGWTADPATYHPTPPAYDSPVVHPEEARGIRFEHLSIESGYEPHPGEPGRRRWMAQAPNRTAHVWVKRHRGEPRPWVVCLHGFRMGSPAMDFRGFRTGRLYKDAGYNVALPVFPLHGPRRNGKASGEGFLGFDVLNTVHGLAQAIWDLRRLVRWLVEVEGATSIVLQGVSLGGYTTALAAGLVDDLDGVIAGIPVVDFPALILHHATGDLRARAVRHHLGGDEMQAVFRPVSPLAVTPSVPVERRFVFAGLGDRMSTPGQAHRLWQHWEQPAAAWYPGTHVGYFMSRDVERFVADALALSLSPDR